jgi:hypothetical protein
MLFAGGWTYSLTDSNIFSQYSEISSHSFSCSYSIVFEIYTNTSSNKLGAVITQENSPIVFFSWKLSTTQCKYVTKIEQLARVQREAVGQIHKSVY